jgi:cell envelope opacity-associated protein A
MSPVYQSFGLLWHLMEEQELDTERATMFGQSHSHKIWRMMDALIDANPEWADQDTFEADRAKILQYGISMGMTMEQLFRISNPDVIFGLWTAAEAKGSQD